MKFMNVVLFLFSVPQFFYNYIYCISHNLSSSLEHKEKQISIKATKKTKQKKRFYTDMRVEFFMNTLHKLGCNRKICPFAKILDRRTSL